MGDLQTQRKVSVDEAKRRLRATAEQMDERAREERKSVLMVISSVLASAGRGGAGWQLARGAAEMAWSAIKARRSRQRLS